ncbi:proteasome activator complex subunit 4B-like [Venturia canescens]|uniref:proteasome activator complex subunit 4B-like n=1 Tax=Venturia canescens TaxID=32260 RepID=UPI001C9D1709|nr:proteasome activator complex subunit 4B-like [Venturia canescens]
MEESVESDIESMESSTESISFQYQRPISNEKFLPYADVLDRESDILLADIKGQLGRAIMLRQLHPECVLWVGKLRRFMSIYGYKFSKEDHIVLVKLMYELVTMPDLDLLFINTFGNMFNKLLQKPDLISPEEMELPWKPLYGIVKKIMFTSQSKEGLQRFPFISQILQTAVLRAKIHFPVTATQEILDEFRPRICPLDLKSMAKTIEMLQWFLPVSLFPKDHHLGYKLWFDELMSLWKACHNAPTWEDNMMWLVARLASHNIGYIDWEPHIPMMYTRFVRCLNLPVYYKQIHGGKVHKFKTRPMAIWIVSSLGNGSSSQMYLEKLLKTIETYFHQANCGPWVMKLREVLDNLAYFFIIRLHNERFGKKTWVHPTPDSHKLTDADIDAFVKAVMPVAMTALFSRIGLLDACKALQHLATVRPNLVIPDVIDRIYSTLDSLTEPHKFTAAMAGIAAVARPMVQGSRNVNEGYAYAEGPSHVLPLLFSVLPGIDANDSEKCFTTCRLISTFAILLPFVDTSKCTVPMDEDERLVSESTSRFEDFVLQFFDRIFSLIDSSTLEFLAHENRAARDGKSKLETMSEAAIASVCSVLLSQTSETIFKSALHKLRQFVTERILETTVSGQIAAAVCREFAKVNGTETLRALVPTLSEIIIEMIGDGDEVIKEENLDHRLLHAMLLLSAAIDTQGNNLVPYIDTLTNVLDKILHLKSREGSQIACRILEHLFCSLSKVSSTKFTNNGRDYNDPEYPYFREWGMGSDISNFKIEWYVPGTKEIAILQALFSRYVPPEISKIQQYSAQQISLTRDELLMSLNIICNALGGSEMLYPIYGDTPSDLDPGILARTSFLPTLGVKGEIRMPDGSNVYECICRTMIDLQEMMLNNFEDDTKSLFAIVRIWSTFLLGKYRTHDHFGRHCKNFKLNKSFIKDKLVQKKGQMGGSWLRGGIGLHHEHRAQMSCHRFTEAHKTMTLELFKLATSRYADVRIKAQDVLTKTFNCFPFSYTVLTTKMLEILSIDPEENHEAYKGLLYLLLNIRSGLIAVRYWGIVRTLWPAIISSKSSEKLSVIRLKENLVQTVNANFGTIAIRYEVPDSCVSLGQSLWQNSPHPKVSQPSAEEILRGRVALEEVCKSNEELYDGVLNDLMHSILEGNLHWRHRSMAMSFIMNLAHPKRSYPAEVVRYFVNALVHESLEERKIANETVVYMLTQQKRKHVKVEADLEKLQSQRHPLVSPDAEWYPGVRSDNIWLQYNYETRPLSAEQWEEGRYVHQGYTGYYTWPKKLEIYAPTSEQPSLDPGVRVLNDQEREIDRFFSNARNVEKLIKYNSLEERKGQDKFRMIRARLFKGLFRNHGIVHMKIFLPHLEHLVADSHESSQRCAAEIIAGLIRGTKHWPFEMVSEMWSQLTPVIRTALNNLTVETVPDWGMCFCTAQERRDPNRQHWLLECLMEEPPLGDSTTSSVECGRLHVLQTVLGQQSWRVVELLNRLVARIEKRLLTNPFQNLRGRLGFVLSTIYAHELRFPGSANDRLSPKAHQLLERIMPTMRTLEESTSNAVESSSNSNENLVLSRVAQVNLDAGTSTNTIESTNNEQTIRLFKTTCKWVMASACRLLYGSLPEFFEILPIACYLENSEADEELSNSCSATLAVLAQALTPSRDMDVALETVERISRSVSWSARAAGLSFLENFVFYNMGTILSRTAWVNTVRVVVLQLLEDERLEVREKAAQVLCGLLHCSLIEEQTNLLDEFKSKSKRRIKKRDDIRLRHAGVLGLCAFIRAHPYDVPPYVPSVFEHLGIHLNDPQPIPTTIRKTLGDFKRTHYDGWAVHSLRFTEEQLGLLQDLTVPPSYYA